MPVEARGSCRFFSWTQDIRGDLANTFKIQPFPSNWTVKVLNEVIHDVLYALHQKQTIPPEALVTEFERICQRVRVPLRWVMFACFGGMCGLALFAFWSESISEHWVSATTVLLLMLMASAVLHEVCDALPMIRNFSRFHVYTYQIRQLEAAHDLLHAADLERFGLPALIYTDKWLGLRIERIKLRLGIAVGGSDKVAILALIAGAWTIWHNFPRVGSVFEQYLYLMFGVFLGGLGTGGMFANAMIAKLSYQRDLLAMAICRFANR